AEPVTIAGFSRSCNCETVTPPQLTIPAGGRSTVLVRIDLADKFLKGQPRGSNRFATTVSPRLPEHKGETVSWTIKGRVRRSVKVAKELLDFGETSDAPVGPKPKPQALKVRILSPAIRRLDIGTERGWFRLTVTREIKDDRGYRVTAVLNEV